jgi:cytochrome c-type biogenesis protein CcmH/NrfG
LSEVYYSMKRYPDAATAARTGVERDATAADAWTRLALACIPLGRREEALHAATTAVRLAPNDEAANAILAELSGRR